MKGNILSVLTILVFLSFLFASCKSTEVVTPEVSEPVVVQEEVTEEISEAYIEEDEVEVIEEVELTPEDEEYLRSTDELPTEESVSREEFEEDKAAILQIIEELSSIMEKNDAKAWLQYITPASISYYSDPKNIRTAQKKLPDKTIQLHGIGDYFKYVFIPARKRSTVDEIRYISKTNVKAVQIKEDGTVVIYYYFEKINNEWLVSIPPLS